MVRFTEWLLLAAAFPLFAVARPAASEPIDLLAKRNTDSEAATVKRSWSGIKAYQYSPTCGKDGDTRGYTWAPSQISRGCYSYNNGQDMWSIEWSGETDIARALGGCKHAPYITVYHHCADCNCHAVWFDGSTGGEGAGCLEPEESIKSFRITC